MTEVKYVSSLVRDPDGPVVMDFQREPGGRVLTVKVEDCRPEFDPEDLDAVAELLSSTVERFARRRGWIGKDKP